MCVLSITAFLSNVSETDGSSERRGKSTTVHTELKVFLFFFYTNYTMYIGFDNICMYMYIHDFDGSIPATLLFALSCKKNSRLLLSLHGPMVACRTFFSRLVALLSFTSNSLARTHALARVQIT